MELKIPKDSFKVTYYPCNVRVICDEPMAKLGFLYFKLNGIDAGRIVFNKEPVLVFHFNQTVLALDTSDQMRRGKLIIREAICEHFGAVDKTGDLED